MPAKSGKYFAGFAILPVIGIIALIGIMIPAVRTIVDPNYNFDIRELAAPLLDGERGLPQTCDPDCYSNSDCGANQKCIKVNSCQAWCVNKKTPAPTKKPSTGGGGGGKVPPPSTSGDGKADCEAKGHLWTGYKCIAYGGSDQTEASEERGDAATRVWCPPDPTNPTRWKQSAPHWRSGSKCLPYTPAISEPASTTPESGTSGPSLCEEGDVKCSPDHQSLIYCISGKWIFEDMCGTGMCQEGQCVEELVDKDTLNDPNLCKPSCTTANDCGDIRKYYCKAISLCEAECTLRRPEDEPEPPPSIAESCEENKCASKTSIQMCSNGEVGLTINCPQGSGCFNNAAKYGPGARCIPSFCSDDKERECRQNEMQCAKDVEGGHCEKSYTGSCNPQSPKECATKTSVLWCSPADEELHTLNCPTDWTCEDGNCTAPGPKSFSQEITELAFSPDIELEWWQQMGVNAAFMLFGEGNQNDDAMNFAAADTLLFGSLSNSGRVNMEANANSNPNLSYLEAAWQPERGPAATRLGLSTLPYLTPFIAPAVPAITEGVPALGNWVVQKIIQYPSIQTVLQGVEVIGTAAVLKDCIENQMSGDICFEAAGGFSVNPVQATEEIYSAFSGLFSSGKTSVSALGGAIDDYVNVTVLNTGYDFQTGGSTSPYSQSVTLETGERIGLVEQIGAGVQADIYLGEYAPECGGGTCAVKIFKSEQEVADYINTLDHLSQADKDFNVRSLIGSNETQMNIMEKWGVQGSDVPLPTFQGRLEGGGGYAMDLTEGNTLREILTGQGGIISPEQYDEVLTAVYGYQGITGSAHGDLVTGGGGINTGNIMFDSQGKVILFDPTGPLYPNYLTDWESKFTGLLNSFLAKPDVAPSWSLYDTLPSLNFLNPSNSITQP